MNVVDPNNSSKKAAVIAGANTGVYGLRVYGGPTDPISDIPVYIDFEHHQVHEGETHETQLLISNIGTGTVQFAIVVPTSIYPHILFSMSAFDGNARFDFYETATFTGGTPMTLYNANRNSSVVPGVSITSGITSANGTLMPWSFYAGSGNNSSGVNRSSEERILKTGTTYRIDVVGLNTGTDVLVNFRWYEDLGV